MVRLARVVFKLLFIPPIAAAAVGWLAGPAFLHPVRRELSPDLVRLADVTFAKIGARREDFDVHTPDGIPLRGWKVRASNPNGNWVLVFHGVADNRIGVLDHSRILLMAGYNVVMMDSRAHGASGGPIATYGWLERQDTRAIIDALIMSEERETAHPTLPASFDYSRSFHIFALGESMGAGIALQSAAADPRIEAVVAEASFANLTEAAYDYAGFRCFPWLGKTLLAPGAWMMVYRGESLAGFRGADVSPEKAVAERAFPVFLICDANDVALPCRHTQRIYASARGPKQMWVVPGAFHTAALGYEPVEFRQRVLSFLESAGLNSPLGPHYQATHSN